MVLLATNRCYTPTEFALFGIGAIVMGVMLGVVGISWFKHQVHKLVFHSLTLRPAVPAGREGGDP
jgi:hypothetical protein